MPRHSRKRGRDAARCAEAVDPGHPRLPVAGTGTLSHLRHSRNARRRAGVLLAVHLVVAAHVTHFLVRGRSVSPVEPSETMYTLELGQINAGFVFLLVALAGTLVFGRFFCGWGCHLVALQDLCGWAMKQLGVRPRPFRSRLLLFAPLVVALYMFVWPSLSRLVFGGEAFPGWSNHLTTTTFWKTFPGPLFAVLTFAVCGFAAVYFLGAKGFCTYGCPYGSLFGMVDRFSPGRIVVDASCEQCGHCTATCTSNVLVHEEVRRYGQVVDPGCMKCMDCVSVCPKDALRFSFGTPPIFAGKPAGRPGVQRYPLGLGAELGVAGVCLASTLALRGLYDGPPLLLSVALGGITGFLALVLWRLFRRSTVRVQNLTLKREGRITPTGRALAVLVVGWLAFTTHSGFVQWHRAWGSYHLARTEAPRAAVLTGTVSEAALSSRQRRASRKARKHYSRAARWGLVGVPEIELGLAWCELLRGNRAAAEAHVREALALRPDEPTLHDNLVDLLAGAGDAAGSLRALEAKLARLATEPGAEDLFRLGGLLAANGRLAEAVPPYLRGLATEPDAGTARYDLGGVYRRLGRPDEAIAQLEEARRLLPDDADVHVELGLAWAAAGHPASAIECFERAIELDPEDPESRWHLPALIRDLRAAPHAREE